MSSTVDANILVYASNTADPMHGPAQALVARLAAGPELVHAPAHQARLLFGLQVMQYVEQHESVFLREVVLRDIGSAELHLFVADVAMLRHRDLFVVIIHP